MMGLPCLRVNGSFFASSDRRTGNLLVKLPEARVSALVRAGRAEPFAPAGRTFRQWAAIPDQRARTWRALLDEALAYVNTLPAQPEKPNLANNDAGPAVGNGFRRLPPDAAACASPAALVCHDGLERPRADGHR